MRYVYELKYKEHRNSINLQNYEKDIIYSIKSFFEDKNILEEFNVEKDSNIVVKDRSFEFSFPGCLPQGSLRQMGKFLAKHLKRVKGFIRKNNNAYVFISYDEERDKDEKVLLEFIDSSTLDISNSGSINEARSWIDFYGNLELSVSYISLHKAKYIFGEIENKLKEKKEIIFEVEIKHRTIAYSDEDVIDYIGVKSCIVEHLYSAGLYQHGKIDFVDIISLYEVSDEFERRIKNKFDNTRDQVFNKYRIEDNSKVRDIIYSSLNRYSSKLNICDEDKNFIFKVYNVGQGLSTSLQIELKNEESLPFLYFDYGMGCHRHKNTCPSNLSLPADKNTIIILSHIHEDHWCGFRENKNKDVLEATWIIPQAPSKSLLKLLADVNSRNGRFIFIDTSKGSIDSYINNVCIRIGNHNVKSKYIHETGIALMIESNKNNRIFRILVSGDQMYKNHIPNFLIDVNILVACHHGGDYGSPGAVPSSNNEKNCVIYSYGKGNKYKHPSKTYEYSNNGWNNRHDTVIGDYEIRF